ncbi:hypothetical protein BRD02_00930 [Halobacteriales archaeon QS_8_69_73]|nr:MAG: hypothetical protein BRD02_00930 [Halobacteriales archaeon QS_8_69_73]
MTTRRHGTDPNVEERRRRGDGRPRGRVDGHRRRRRHRTVRGLAFSVSGVAGGTIALVSRRYGADADEGPEPAVGSSVLLIVATLSSPPSGRLRRR